ncbi:TerB family tellurite resistance protein [Aureimonas jatrophae]|uniref:Uncharacterized conserved protein, tellurite resistance protein B (TerB) family n=1 Tax=Aureimonas jatrophae TaxID=1166073 RepID=A0A1H0KW84_9HYPH|nr:TerB family tellurite resistance protein [Aureimonas jatrophae]MBB3948909.1 putative tellurite resistance protein B-like protein [Aureimonas jatrophae]SDO60199.1 Uncharacterized conserved protein, tellurite resistance protein B (TerB) family [Aureimonas jatrophae]
MFDSLKDFLRTLSGEDGAHHRSDDPQVAAAALLFHVAEADGTASATEREALRTLLRREYGLDADAARAVVSAGQAADADSVDLFQFTHVLMRHLSAEQRVRFVELLWEMVFVDGEVHELEDNLVWRISELLGVSSRDRMLTKREAAGRYRDETADPETAGA